MHFSPLDYFFIFISLSLPSSAIHPSITPFIHHIIHYFLLLNPFIHSLTIQTVKGTDGTAVHIETYSGPDAGSAVVAENKGYYFPTMSCSAMSCHVMIYPVLSCYILPIDHILTYIFVLFSNLHSQINYFFLIFMINNSLILYFLHSLFPYLYDGIISPATIEGTSTPLPPPTQAWITIAAANVLPEVLLRLASSIISARGYNISRYGRMRCASLYCTVLYCVVLYCTVLY